MYFLENKIHIHCLGEKTKNFVWKYTNLLHYSRCKLPAFSSWCCDIVCCDRWWLF